LAEAGNPPVLLLDEVQNIPHWGRWVRTLLVDRRELKSLAEAVEATGRRPLLITWDLEDVPEVRGAEAIPLWRWLLSQTLGRGEAQTTV
jgi:predicted AAA+ superfamily ATPase